MDIALPTEIAEIALTEGGTLPVQEATGTHPSIQRWSGSLTSGWGGGGRSGPPHHRVEGVHQIRITYGVVGDVR